MIPQNAYAYGDSWKCNPGYEKTGSICSKRFTTPQEACQSYIKDRYTVVKTDEYGRKTEQIVLDQYFNLIGTYPDGQKYNGHPYMLLNTGIRVNGALDFFVMVCVIKKSTWGESNEILGIEID